MNRCFVGDCRDTLRQMAQDGVRAQTCVTSPPYFGLRDYGVDGQIGLESSPDEYVREIVAVFRLVRKILADDGTLWVNLGDSYMTRPNGGIGHNSQLHGSKRPHVAYRGAHGQRSTRRIKDLKHKDLMGIPWMVAFALRADGWYLRQDIIWSKPNPMPESVRDRCTKAHEYIFLLSKSKKYYFDVDAIKEPCTSDESRPTFRGGAYVNNSTFNNAEGGNGNVVGNVRRSGNKERKSATQRGCPSDGVAGSVPWEGDRRNKRSVWSVRTKPYPEAHFATFPPALIEPCILAGSRPGDIVVDPFFGSGTTGEVAQRLGRQWMGCEINPAYSELAAKRTLQQGMVL